MTKMQIFFHFLYVFAKLNARDGILLPSIKITYLNIIPPGINWLKDLQQDTHLIKNYISYLPLFYTLSINFVPSYQNYVLWKFPSYKKVNTFIHYSS